MCADVCACVCVRVCVHVCKYVSSKEYVSVFLSLSICICVLSTAFAVFLVGPLSVPLQLYAYLSCPYAVLKRCYIIG